MTGAAPEIHRDELAGLLERLAAEEPIETILEIGTSTGAGSTAALVAGAARNPRHPVVFGIELDGERLEEARARFAGNDCVRLYHASAVHPKWWASEADIRAFYRAGKAEGWGYAKATVLRWLWEGDALWERESERGAGADGIRQVREEHGVQKLGLVLIDGSEFSARAELEEVYGARVIVLDDIGAFKNSENYERLCADPTYERVAENRALRNGYAVFRSKEGSVVADEGKLPVHFLTIVLNGEPFIRYHHDVFESLPFDWRWHIVEGAADLVGDTGWSLPNGGRLTDRWHRNGSSVDGTSEYVESVAREDARVRLYRLANGGLFQGKLEMVNAPLAHIEEECLLWQVDADELWTAEQIAQCRQMFLERPEKEAAWFWCHFFVGPDRVISTRKGVLRNGYANNPSQEWLRVWRYRPGMRFVSHEPPVLQDPAAGHHGVGAKSCFGHATTEEAGLVFQHMAYVTEAQVAFKEEYYGYRGAVGGWRRLQKAPCGAEGVGLQFYLPWVPSGVRACRAAQVVIPLLHVSDAGYVPDIIPNAPSPPPEPIAIPNAPSPPPEPTPLVLTALDTEPLMERVLAQDPTNADALHEIGRARLRAGDVESAIAHLEQAVGVAPQVAAFRETLQVASAVRVGRIAVDGCAWQIVGRSGIHRVWANLLQVWAREEFARKAFGSQLLLLDRDGTAPAVEGIARRVIPRHDYARLAEDRAMLEQVCAEEGIALFVSTYFTFPERTASVFLCHDMIPDELGWDLNMPMWQEKKAAINRACAFAAVSQATADALVARSMRAKALGVTVCCNGVDHAFFYPPPTEDAARVRVAVGKPFVLMVGERLGYKNGEALFKAMADPGDMALVCVGGGPLQESLRALAPTCPVAQTTVFDEELRALYGAAVALVAPSIAEGFGLSVLEAMACGCPVITTRRGALPEVCGDAALYADPGRPDEIRRLIDVARQGTERERLCALGIERAKSFSWGKQAGELREVIDQALGGHSGR